MRWHDGEVIGLDGKGTWGAVSSRAYEALVARGQHALYDQLLDLLELPSGDPGWRHELLDVGCGPGHAALRLAVRGPAARVVGVDSSDEMVHLASRRADRSGVGARVRFVAADAMELPFEAERFAAAISLASIKHWPDRGRGLAELHRVLAPGAPLLVVEADRGASGETLSAYAARWPWLPPAALRLAWRGYIARGSIDAEEARALLERSPFAGGEVLPVAGTPLLALRARRS